ncbi:MAG: hypothetical protein J5645_01275 [Lachnospiraceae bacterium]|nr:hypothetical protein [Lachnospiraceae bacterium]
MDRIRKTILLFAIAVLACGLVSACGKSDKDDDKSENDITATVSPSPAMTLTPTLVPLDVKAFKHSTMPMEMNLPEGAKVNEAESDLVAETAEYILYVCEMNTCDGELLYGVSDLLSVVNNPEQKDALTETLHLKSYSVPVDAKTVFYENINDVPGIWSLLSDMEFADSPEKTSRGNGFVMMYNKKEGLGVYVVLGIYKNASVDARVKEMLQSCALSLVQSDDVKDKYVLWTETLPDGTKVRASLGNDIIPEAYQADQGVCLYFDEEKVGHYFLQHYFKVGKASSKEYLQSIIDAFKADGTEFSETEEVKGKLSFQKVTMTHELNGKQVQETICVAVDDKNYVWIVDLFGTPEQTKAQEKNLLILLGTIQENK